MGSRPYGAGVVRKRRLGFRNAARVADHEGAEVAIKITVNGQEHSTEAEASTPLLYVLRNDLELRGPKFGCGLSQCGACTVIINGVATRSCVTSVSSVRNEITTLEGLAKNGKLHPVQQAW